MDTTSSDPARPAVDSASSKVELEDSFVWEWYIRLKVTFSDPYTAADLEANIDEVLKEFEDFWLCLKSAVGLEEGKMWPTALVDTATAKTYFFLIGIPRLPSTEMGKARERLKDWVEGVKERKGEWEGLEARVVSRKVVRGCGFEVYRQGKRGVEGAGAGMEMELERKGKGEEQISRKSRKDKMGGFPAAGGFQKVKGSNPAEVRRQFLEHSMEAAAPSSPPPTDTTSSGKLRPGKEVLNRMKFDEKYDIGGFVVGYIDRRGGVLEASVGEWEGFGREELMAYVKNTKSGEIVWDKARRVDLVFGGKAGA